ncbi:DUF4956 domain-containing protein [Fusibacter ferrireducens]|nr:DUF4956 domain-containing protein [Fusibacter ferrireducens]
MMLLAETNFTDIIKNSVLNSDKFGRISTVDIIIGLVISYLVGMFIYFVYKKSFKGVVYSFTFNYSLVLMTMITTLVVMTISSNIVLSLGMVGALSIVRFRTAVKDPLDIVFMFWAITMGITIGAGIYPLSFMGSVVIGMAILSMNLYRNKDKTFILIVNYEEKAYSGIKSVLSRFPYSVKSKSIKNGKIELTVEVKLKTSNTTFVEEISDVEGVSEAILVNYNGEYAQ